MNRKNILKAVSIVFAVAAIFAIICGLTVTGSGFLDLSNLVRTVFIGVAVVCGILAVLAWRSSKPKD